VPGLETPIIEPVTQRYTTVLSQLITVFIGPEIQNVHVEVH